MKIELFVKICAAVITLCFVTIATTQVLSYRASKEPRGVRIVESIPLSIDEISDTVKVSGKVDVRHVADTVDVIVMNPR